MIQRLREIVGRLVERYVPGSTPGSKRRRALTYVVRGICLIFVFEAILASFGVPLFLSAISGIVYPLLSIFFFGIVCVGVVFLASESFRPDPVRLALDSLLSIFFTIMAFAILYRTFGFSLDTTCVGPFNPIDAIYFSAVTFSTLGFGDFRPCESVRLFAALQAIIGNLHLGLIVGAAFLLVKNEEP